MNSVEPSPNSPGRWNTKATFPFCGQGVILAKRVSPTLKRASPELSQVLASNLRMPAKSSPTDAISTKGYSHSLSVR